MDVIRESLAIGLVFVLLWTALWFLRRKAWLRRTKTGPVLLASRGKLALSARHSVHLVQIGDRNLILALHPEGVTFLGDVRPAIEPEQKDRAAI
jgi:flagellar biogenesis protein FliO